MPSKSNGKTNGSGPAPDQVGIEMTDRRGPSSTSSGGRSKYPRLSAEIDEPLLKERLLRDDEGAIIHDEISSLEDSQASEEGKPTGSSEPPVVIPPEEDEPFQPRRKSISEPARLVGRTGSRFRDLKNFMETGGFENKTGMSVAITSLFIIGETAGGGLVALPTVMANCGVLLGTLVIILGAFICGYAGVQLSECWSIMMIRYLKYRYHTNKPYPAIARRAIGRKTAWVVSLILNITQFMTAVVFLLLGSKNLTSFVLWVTGRHISFCYVICVVSVLIFPILLLRSPKDFWVPIMFAMFTTSIACILVVIGAYIDSPACYPVNEMHPFNWGRILQSFGTVMFAYGGHGAFPTIQHDMKQPHKFEKAVTGAFTGIACMYLPVSLAGALVYGSSLGDVVIFSIQSSWIQQVVNMLITSHVFLALTIVFNPINQEAEQIFKVPEPFSFHRVLVRGAILILVVFSALSVPNFGPLLDFVGASTITLMAIVLPPLFSLYLNARLNKFGTKGTTLEPMRISDLWKHNRFMKFFWNVLLITIGLTMGSYSSYQAFWSIIGSSFQKPCYADFVFGVTKNVTIAAYSDALGIPLSQKYMCCGPNRDVSAWGSEYCLNPNTLSSMGSHG